MSPGPPLHNLATGPIPGARATTCRIRRLAALVAVTLFLSAPTATGAEPLFGFNENWLVSGHAVEASNPFRPTVQRLHLNWALIENQQGTYEWTAFDRMYRNMVAQGAPPIALVLGTPCWAAGNPACLLQNVAYPVPPAHYASWERFIRAVVRRYPRLVALEVWNEPNLAAYHYPRPDVTSYVGTLRHAHRASKAVRPDLPVLGGSLSPTTTWRRVRRDGGFPRRPPARLPYAPFLRQMYRLGAAEFMDGLAFHVYPNFVRYLRRKRLTFGVRRGFRHGVRRDIRRQIRTLRRIQRAHRARSPIWITEAGLCTAGSRERRTSLPEQAVGLRQLYVTLQRLKVRAILTHRLWDVRAPGSNPNDIEAGCGLTDVRGRRKPAWAALRRVRPPPTPR